jgi:uncharacterized GH25 family protein
MRTLQLGLIALGFLQGLSAWAQTNTAETFPLTGKVVDINGRGVAGAVVERDQPDRAQPGWGTSPESRERVTTDANGGFEFRSERRLVGLLARKPGLAPAWIQFTARPGVDQRLILGPPGILTGVVVDETDKPVSGAEVHVAFAISETTLEGGRRTYNYLSGKQARECFSVRTGADGRFSLDGFPTNATADLGVRTAGKALRLPPRDRRGPGGQARTGDKDVRLVVEAAGRVEGRVVVQGSTGPLPVARLTLQSEGGVAFDPEDLASNQSGADGVFRISDVPAGSYRVQAVFGTNAVPEWVADTVPVSVVSGQATSGVEVAAARGGLLEVVVVRKQDRQPLQGVGVNVYKQNLQRGASSSRDGSALLRLLPGDYQVSAARDGWRSQNVAAAVEADKTNRLEIELAPLPKITGTVRRPDGQLAGGLDVQIVGGYSGDDTKSKTDANGRFEVEWDPQRYGQSDASFCLLIRDAQRNLAVAQDLEEESGPLDLRLAPGLTMIGRAECNGKPVTNAGAALVFWSGNRGMHLYGFCTGTNSPGHLEVPALPPGRKYGLYVSAPGYGQKYVTAVETDAEARRVELDPVELKPANLKLAGKVVDAEDKPVAGVYVNLYGEGQPNANVRTDRQGQFSFDQVCEGQVRLSANLDSSRGNISVEAGETNVVLRLGESESYSSASSSKTSKLKGLVTAPDGQPVVGAQVEVFPSGASRKTKTGPDGAFSLTWSLQPWQMRDGNPSLVVRDLRRNLATAEELSEETTNLNLQLKPALTLTGRVEAPEGAPLTNAQVGVWLLAGNTSSQVEEQLSPTDFRGAFRIAALPVGLDYTVFATARKHGRSEQKIQADAETNRIELPVFVLKPANKILAGQVLNPDDKPVTGATVSLSGDDQPQASTTTDRQGRFRLEVCEGRARLFANAASGYASANAEAGDTNVVLQLARNESSSRQSTRAPSLKGKPLPDLSALGLTRDTVPAGKPVLLCLLDVEQRPSRRLARLLAERYEAHRQKGLTILAVQAAVTSPDSLKEWKQANPVPFPVGQVPDASDKTKWVSGIEALPWLILTDTQGRVTAEGFSIEELDAQMPGSRQ